MENSRRGSVCQHLRIFCQLTERGKEGAEGLAAVYSQLSVVPIAVVVNTIMAFMNVPSYIARRLIKQRNPTREIRGADQGSNRNATPNLGQPELNRIFMSKMTKRMIRMKILDIPRAISVDQELMRQLRRDEPTAAAA